MKKKEKSKPKSKRKKKPGVGSKKKKKKAKPKSAPKKQSKPKSAPKKPRIRKKVRKSTAKKPGKTSRPKAKKPTREVLIGRSKPPEGFTIDLGDGEALVQEQAYAMIDSRLNDARSRLPDGLVSQILIHAYADGSVDGELYVKVPKDSKEAEFDLYDAFGNMTIGKKFWITAGARYIIEKDEEIYRRFRGLNQVETNYQAATQPNIVEVHNILRHSILPGMKNRYRREAYSIYIRMHWNPEGDRPKR